MDEIFKAFENWSNPRAREGGISFLPNYGKTNGTLPCSPSQLGLTKFTIINPTKTAKLDLSQMDSSEAKQVIRDAMEIQMRKKVLLDWFVKQTGAKNDWNGFEFIIPHADGESATKVRIAPGLDATDEQKINLEEAKKLNLPFFLPTTLVQ